MGGSSHALVYRAGVSQPRSLEHHRRHAPVGVELDARRQVVSRAKGDQ